MIVYKIEWLRKDTFIDHLKKYRWKDISLDIYLEYLKAQQIEVTN